MFQRLFIRQLRRDLSKWPKTWKICQKSWKEKFPEPEYKHIMWTDEDLNNFVRKNYPDFYPIYKDYNSNMVFIQTMLIEFEENLAMLSKKVNLMTLICFCYEQYQI